MPIPEFPVFKTLGIEDRDQIESYFRESNPINSEFTFTNLFIWRSTYHFQVSLHRNALFILSCPEPKDHFFLPPTGFNTNAETFMTLLDFMRHKGWSPKIKRVPKHVIDRAQLWEDSRFNIQFNRDDADYVYLTQRLITLAGKKLHRKKNHLNQFIKNYPFVFEPLAEQNGNECLEMQEVWCDIKKCDEQSGLMHETIAIREALKNMEKLSCTGGVIRISGHVEAFSLGEALNSDTAVIHIEKANPDIRGLYAAINQQCCEHLWADFTYVNREQDLGEEGLRKAKLSYHPYALIEKYTITSR